MRKPFGLSWQTLLLLASGLLLVAFILFATLDGPTAIRRWYITQCIGSDIQARWGFSAEYVRVGKREMYGITGATPGGAFDRAGFKKGDVFTDPWLYHHGNADYCVLEGLHSICDRPMQEITVAQVGEFVVTRAQGGRVLHLDCSSLTPHP